MESANSTPKITPLMVYDTFPRACFDHAFVFRVPELTIVDHFVADTSGLPADALAYGPRLLSEVADASFLTQLLRHGLPFVDRHGWWRTVTELYLRKDIRVPVLVWVLGPLDPAQPADYRLLVIDLVQARVATRLQQREQTYLRALLDYLPDTIYFKDRQSRFICVNQSMVQKNRCASAEDMLGQSDFDCFTKEHAQQAFDDEQRIMQTGEALLGVEEKETWPDGRITWVSTSKLPLRNLSGEIIGTFGVSRDITEHKRIEAEHRQMEAQLLLSQKLESVGRLAAGIAHEINTPTQFITDNTRFLAEAFQHFARVLAAHRKLVAQVVAGPVAPQAVQALQDLENQEDIDYLLKEVPSTCAQSLEGLARIARIVGAMKDFSHPKSVDKAPTNLVHLLNTTITVSRHEWKYVAEVVTEFAPDLPLVPCVADELSQAVLNLLINAAHAIEEVPTTLEGGTKKLGCITLRAFPSDHAVCIEIADTGAGIPEAVRPRIFDPFFTTKGIGKGTGQGLSVVHNVVVHNHGGRIDFTSVVGQGTTFRLFLPLTPSPATPPSTAPSPLPAP